MATSLLSLTAVSASADDADPVIPAVADEHPAGGVHGHTPGGLDLRLVGGAAVAAEPGAARPREGGHDPGGHPPDAVVLLVGDVEVAGAVDGHVPDPPHSGMGGGAAVAAVATARAGHGGDHPGAVDPPHPAVAVVGDVEPAGGV